MFSTNLSYWKKRNKTFIYFSCEVEYSVGNLSSQISPGTALSTTRTSSSPNRQISRKVPISKVLHCLYLGLQSSFPKPVRLSPKNLESKWRDWSSFSTCDWAYCLLPWSCGHRKKTGLSLTLMGPGARVQMLTPMSCV